ncbi:helix-turn-helix domain-containing protein [Nocardiopsis sp. CNT-189]|uniref:BldC family transcriptional regulator n=1 Tax=Nocardiopsis oceanisediminis TaxID=2816862 RepID=UPI003B2916B4
MIHGAEPPLTSGEVADLFRVDPKTVTRWAATGKLRSFRTPGGHRRFAAADIRSILAHARQPRREQGRVAR